MPNPWRSRVFWGGLLIVFGLVLLLNTLGVFAGLNFNLWGVLWPVAMMAAGVWLLWVSWGTRRWQQQAEPLSIPLPEVARARVRMNHGAGRVESRYRCRSGRAAGWCVWRRCAAQNSARGRGVRGTFASTFTKYRLDMGRRP